jgi:glycine oxidase
MMHIGIVGAGVMGRLLACELMQADYKVTIYQRDANSCSQAAAGILAPISELEKSDLLIYQLGIDAINSYWPKIINQSKEKIFYRQSGTLVLSHPREQQELKRFINTISLKSSQKFNELGLREILQLEPELTKFAQGYFLAEEAQIDNQTLLSVLEDYLEKTEVKWYKNSFVQEVLRGKININGKTEKFDLVIDCRGIGAKSLFENLHAVRGELLWLHAPEVNINRMIRFLHPRYNIYIVPRPGNIYLLGATEIHTENYREISVRSALELLTAAYYVHPGFAEASILKTVTHCRPTLPDHLPQIKHADGLIAINGLYRHGFLIAPTLAHEVKLFLQGGLRALNYPSIWRKIDD